MSFAKARWNLGLRTPGDDPRRQLARLIRNAKNSVRRQGRKPTRETVMRELYDYCLEQKLEFRESMAIAGWYDRVGLYALDRALKSRLAKPLPLPLDNSNNSVTR